MTDEGAYNLLIAITERAYKDYVIGLKLMRTNFRKKTHHVELMMGHFETAKIFLEGTSMGDYLIMRAEKEINDDSTTKKLRHYSGWRRREFKSRRSQVCDQEAGGGDIE